RSHQCDLERPKCGRCAGRGIPCEGYDPDRIFVDQNNLFRRKTLIMNGESNSSKRAIDPPSLERPYTDEKSIQLIHRYRTSPSSYSINHIHSLARSASYEKHIELYLDMYLPLMECDRTPLLQYGLSNVVTSLYLQDDALQMALVALVLAAVGQARRYQPMMEQGKQLYGRALREVTKALSDPRRVGSAAVLGVPRVLGMFEVSTDTLTWVNHLSGSIVQMLFGSDSNLSIQARSWESHAAGDMALMKAKGPRAFRTGVAHSLFLEARLNPIILGITTRKATPMDTEKWKSVPWEGREKLPMDSLIDILAAIPELLEGQDKVATCPNHERETHMERLVQKCQKTDIEMDAWFFANRDKLWEPEIEEPVPITFPDLVTAYLTVLYWTACLLLYEAIIDTDALLPMPPAFYQPPWQPEKRDLHFYAYRIVRALPYFFRPSSGVWGAVMIAFPVGVVRRVLSRKSSESDQAYEALFAMAWMHGNLPAAIKTFLTSIQGEIERRTHKISEPRSKCQKLGSGSPASGKRQGK
ncbi:hypothetical protein K504DRAFT_374400, partial [Pleomassaria siparia CBS 279.74]